MARYSRVPVYAVSTCRGRGAGLAFRACGSAEFLSFSRKRFWESRFCCLRFSARSASLLDRFFSVLWSALDNLKAEGSFVNSTCEIFEVEIVWSEPGSESMNIKTDDGIVSDVVGSSKLSRNCCIEHCWCLYLAKKSSMFSSGENMSKSFSSKHRCKLGSQELYTSRTQVVSTVA